MAEPTRKRVERIIGELGYRPNAITRSLRVRTSNTIGMIVPDLGNPFHAQLAVAVERAATVLGYATLVAHTTAHRTWKRRSAAHCSNDALMAL